MSDAFAVLSQLSEALAALAAGARQMVAGVQTRDGTRSGVLWRPNAVVVSEQTLPDADEYELRVADRSVKGRIAGRDAGTNVAVLKLEGELPYAAPRHGVAKPGALALVLGAADDGISAQLTMIRTVGGAWQSLAGGTIDHRILVGSPFGDQEGGPVLAADGALLGISTRGARRENLVIPASTVDRSVDTLLEAGIVGRGWLGLALRPVALPETLRPESRQRIGLMIMDVSANSPGAKAGILAGDIVLSAGGVPATRLGSISRQLGPNSIGKKIEIQVARAGSIVTSELAIEPRKPT
jgi:S1-C subfamily serine protease